MKVIHLTGDAEDAGGILSVLRALQSEFQREGTDQAVWVNTMYAESRRPPLAYRRSRHVVGFSDDHWQLIWTSVRSFFDLWHLIRREPFSVLHAHAQGTVLTAVLAHRLLKRPALFTNHSYASRRWVYHKIGNLKSFHVVSLTPNMADYYGLQPGRRPNFWIVPECCGRRFLETPIADGWTMGSDKLRLIGVGSLMRWKRWHLVIEAVAQLSPAERARLQFDLWGGSSQIGDSKQYEKELQESIIRNDLAETIRLRGLTSDIIGRMQEADWFVLPSTNEPCSVALIEALASGLPAVVSASGGNVDIVREGVSGRFFAPDESVSLAGVLRTLLNQPRPPSSPLEIRRTVKQFAPEVVARKYLEIYQIAVSQTSTRFTNAE